MKSRTIFQFFPFKQQRVMIFWDSPNLITQASWAMALWQRVFAKSLGRKSLTFRARSKRDDCFGLGIREFKGDAFCLLKFVDSRSSSTRLRWSLPEPTKKIVNSKMSINHLHRHPAKELAFRGRMRFRMVFFCSKQTAFALRRPPNWWTLPVGNFKFSSQREGERQKLIEFLNYGFSGHFHC